MNKKLHGHMCLTELNTQSNKQSHNARAHTITGSARQAGQSNKHSQKHTNTNKQTNNDRNKQTNINKHKQTNKQTNKHNMPFSPKNWQGLLPSAGCLSMCPQNIKGGCFPSRGTSLDEVTCVIGSVIPVFMYVIKTNY